MGTQYMELVMEILSHTLDVQILTEMDMRILMTHVRYNMEVVGLTDLGALMLMKMESVIPTTRIQI